MHTLERFKPPETTEKSYHVGVTALVGFTKMGVLAKKIREQNVSIYVEPLRVAEIIPMLTERSIDIAVGSMPWSRHLSPDLEIQNVCEEQMVCIAARNHPALKEGLSLEIFTRLPHGRRTFAGTPGMVDEALQRIKRKRWSVISDTTFYGLGLAVANSDIIAVIPESVARLLTHLDIELYEVPFNLEPCFIDMAWCKNRANEKGIIWLSNLIVEVCHTPVKEMDIHKRIKGAVH